MVARIKDVSGALVDFWDWQALGSCNEMDPEFFFHPEGERGGPRRRRIERAKRICQTCPVIEECREYALVNHEPYGCGVAYLKKNATGSSQQNATTAPPRT